MCLSKFKKCIYTHANSSIHSEGHEAVFVDLTCWYFKTWPNVYFFLMSMLPHNFRASYLGIKILPVWAAVVILITVVYVVSILIAMWRNINFLQNRCLFLRKLWKIFLCFMDASFYKCTKCLAWRNVLLHFM